MTSNSSNSSIELAASFSGPLGLIGGSSFLDSHHLASFRPVHVTTSYGRCVLHTNAARSVYFVQRHASDPDHPYSPPHLINKQSLMAALQSLGVSLIIAFGSVGSLKRSIPVGSLLIPDDFLDLTLKPVSMYSYSKSGHIGGSAFDEPLRHSLIALLNASHHHPLPNGVYAQSVGPRFESQAEIRLLGLQGDVVGMTCAHEAILARELNMKLALVTMVDNMANGLADKPISYEEFHAGVKKNLSTMETVLELILKNYTPADEEISKFYAAKGNSASAIAEIQKDENSSVHHSKNQSSTKKSPISVDSIIHAKYIIPVLPDDSVLLDHCVVVEAGLIVAIQPSSMVHENYISNHTEYHNSSALMPGFVNSHTHTGMTLLRGYADDYDLHDWLNNHIWPAEEKLLSPELVNDSAELSIAEMLKSGTTCFNDMYYYPEVVTRLVEKCGIRAVIGIPIIEFPSAYASNADDYLTKGAALRNEYLNHPLIQFSWAPHAPYTVADKTWSQIGKLQSEDKLKSGSQQFSGCKIHTHVHETKLEVNSSANGISSSSRHLSDSQCRPLKNLDSLGLITADSILIHMTQLDEEDFKILENRHSSVVHCPSSNMKLASGFCPVQKLLDSKINVALGTDSSASNNGLDMWNEIRLAALIGKGYSENAEAIPAYEALKMATINGAKALGLDKKIGSIEINKSADFQIISLTNLELIPMYDLLSHLVYSCSSRHVTDCWVAGEKLLSNRKLIKLNEFSIMDKALVWQNKINEFRLNQSTGKKRQRSGENNNNSNSIHSNVGAVLEAPTGPAKKK